jgi:peptidoglycan/LPS O-acetylase OafA/YrhL
MNSGSRTVNAWPSRYEMLDGLRGLAALGVVLHHLGVVADGHFAVMVFFVISGYCITASADSSRRNGVGFRDFMVRRIKRIYPPYWSAMAFFALTRAIKSAMGGPNDLQRPLRDWIENLTLTQWLSNALHPALWPSDNPHLFVAAFWSLNYEEQFYLIIAIALALAANKRIPLIVSVLVLAAIGLAWNFSIPGNWVCGFFVEYWVHFALGACLYFTLCVHTDWRSRLAFVGSVALVGLASAARLIPWTAVTIWDLRSMVELAFLSAVTLSLFFLRPLSLRISRGLVWRPVAALGTVSYSLYLVHQFNLHLVESIAQHLLPARSPHWVLIMTLVGLHVGLATVFWYVCERPFLSRKSARLPIASVAGDVASTA